jgi:hypothetical protein
MMQPVQADTLKVPIIKEQMLIEWFKVDRTVAYVALVLGIFIIIIAYFSGGKENKSKLLFAIISAVVIGILSFPLFIKFGMWSGLFGHQWGEIILLVFFFTYISALACHAYEIVTVSAKEARPH